jgi:putative transposase
MHKPVIKQLPAWLTHYNEIRPHKALRYRSPREYITQIRDTPSGI